tara:strand:+ start:189 stop:332 length:144 start_codon:yes stop_codon:yes gene_type:complete
MKVDKTIKLYDEQTKLLRKSIIKIIRDADIYELRTIEDFLEDDYKEE